MESTTTYYAISTAAQATLIRTERYPYTHTEKIGDADGDRVIFGFPNPTEGASFRSGCIQLGITPIGPSTNLHCFIPPYAPSKPTEGLVVVVR